MKANKKTQNKKNHIVMIAIIAVSVILVSAASIGLYGVYSQDKITLDSKSAIADDVPVAPEVTTTEDLAEVETALSQIDLDDESDLTELDNELNAF